MIKFNGTTEDLQSIVRELSFEGSWAELPGDKLQFICSDGAILNWWPKPKTVSFQGPEIVKEPFEEQVTKAIEAMKGQRPRPQSPVKKPTTISAPKAADENKKVFIVHGHDDVAREQLELVLHKLGLDPFVLANTGGGGLTLIEALENEIGPQQGQCKFGIVLMTPDDIGYAKKDGDTKAAARARQNVVLEMGMLISSLRRNNVAILKKGPIEVPSDAQGIIYIQFINHVKEAVPKLADRLNHAGFNLSSAAITRATS